MLVVGDREEEAGVVSRIGAPVEARATWGNPRHPGARRAYILAEMPGTQTTPRL